ncbi:MAG: Mbeg1-like protein [Christensenellales bacterium]
MDNMHAYLAWAGSQSGLDLPFNELDAIALSQVVHLPLEEAFRGGESISLREAAEALRDLEADKVYEVLLRHRLRVLLTMGEAPRYRDLRLSHFIDEVSIEDETQFCALTLTLSNGICVVCFRGTDLSLAGWKEDFNMSFSSPVPAQRRAIAYLHHIAHASVAPLVLLGHSKGGNLAVYAAAFCDQAVQDRLLAVYSFDGPGLMAEDAGKPGYLRIAGRIRSFLPQNSVVGVLMHQHKPFQVVKSNALSLFQHDPFSWEIKPESPEFVREPGLTWRSRMLDEALDSWLLQMSMDDRRLFCDTVFQVLTAGQDETLGELVRLDRHKALIMLRAIKGVPPPVAKAARKAIGLLFSGTVGTALDVAREAVTELLPGPVAKAIKGKQPPGTDAPG